MESENVAVVGKRSLRQRQHSLAEEQSQSYDSMLCVDAEGKPTNKRKLFCPTCGLPRDPELALRQPCSSGCGAVGTQKQAPQFDDEGERIPDEVIAARKAEQLRALQAGRAAARAAAQVAAQIAAQPKTVKPARAQVAAVKRILTRKAQPTTPVKATTQDLFLSMME